MKKTMINSMHGEGYIYSHDLETKVTGAQSKNPGTEYIAGTVDIATDESMTNIISFHFSYVTATTSKGAKNRTFTVLKDIIDGKLANVMDNGKDKADMITIDSSLALNEFYDKEDKLVSIKRNEGGFVNTTKELKPNLEDRHAFKADMLIIGAKQVDGDPEKGTPDKLEVNGFIFNFRKEILPVTFSVLDPAGIDYILSLEPSKSQPVFINVWGSQISMIIKKVTVEENMFGGEKVEETVSTKKDYVITGMKAPYDWDTEETVLATEVSKALSDREVALADIKKRRDEYQASKTTSSSAATQTTAADALNWNF